VRVRLRRVSGHRVVAARWLRVRAGRRQAVRWRLGAVTASRVPVGRYRLEIRGGRHHGGAGARAPGRRADLRARRRGRLATGCAGTRTVPRAGALTGPGARARAADGPARRRGRRRHLVPELLRAGRHAGLITDVIHPQAVLGLGDFQYDSGTLDLFRAFYDPTWGRFKSMTYPINGDAEDFYGTGDWLTYWSSGAPVTPRAEASYSFNVGSWHIVALNSSCFRRRAATRRPGRAGCAATWLPTAPAAPWRTGTCPTSPRPPRGEDGRPGLKAWYDALYSGGADVLLQAHQHFYERFAPQNPTGGRDTRRGITVFTVGTGGRSHAVPSRPGVQQRRAQRRHLRRAGADAAPDGLRLPLRAGPGSAFRDAGSGTCH
jgi:hypothetical protein